MKMTIEEIFSNILTHMAKGLLIHNQMASLYGFLNLCGYQKCQEYHYYEESRNDRNLQNFFLTHYNKMIHENTVEQPEVIPNNWYKFTKMEVDANNKRSAVKDIMKKWVEWEKETKTLLELSYKQLYELGEIDCAIKIASLIKDVSKELAGAQEMYINLESMGYDIVYIIDWQPDLYKQYCKKIKGIYEGDEND